MSKILMLQRVFAFQGDDNNSDSVKSVGKTGDIRRQDSTFSFESIDDSNDIKNCAEETWNQSKEAKCVF